jgi:hypothetical protein
MRTLRSLLLAFQRALGTARRGLTLAAIVAALGLVEMMVACEPAKDRVLYGPPPADAQQEADVVDEATPDVGQDFAVYYGPPPQDALDESTPPEVDQDFQVLYGPPPQDTLDESAPPEVDQDFQVLYGPPPDTQDELTPPPETTTEYATYYGPQPLYGVQTEVTPAEVEPPDVQKDCPPMAYYGPPPCNSDQECQEQNGANWYCDKDGTLPDGCGGAFSYPQCKPKG